MEKFPLFLILKIGRSNKTRVRTQWQIKIFCDCRMAAKFSKKMVKCKQWFHLKNWTRDGLANFVARSHFFLVFTFLCKILFHYLHFEILSYLYHRYNILTGISNGQEFQIHPRYGLNFQRVRAQRAKSRARQIAWLD